MDQANIRVSPIERCMRRTAVAAYIISFLNLHELLMSSLVLVRIRMPFLGELIVRLFYVPL